jgi:hypothetical protein
VRSHDVLEVYGIPSTFQVGPPGVMPEKEQEYLQITLLGTGGLLTMLTESGSGTLAGSAHQEAFNQVAKADAVMVSEALQRDFDAPLLEAAFPGWPAEAAFELSMEAAGGMAAMAALGTGPV